MQFTINTRVLEHLGRELITSDEVAIVELIKNSYDANAPIVHMHFIDDFYSIDESKLLVKSNKDVSSIISKEIAQNAKLIIIEDNGDGMGQKELEEGFFTIGTDIKKRVKESKNHERLPLGEKGIGRLAAQRLSNVLFIETTNKNSNVTFLVKVAWNEFLNKFEKLDEFELNVWEVSKQRSSYTRLWFLDLNVDFSSFINGAKGYQLSLFNDGQEELTLKEDFQSALSFLSSPFEEEVENFKLRIFLNRVEIETSFQTEAIKIAESEHFFKLCIKRMKPDY